MSLSPAAQWLLVDGVLLLVLAASLASGARKALRNRRLDQEARNAPRISDEEAAALPALLRAEGRL